MTRKHYYFYEYLLQYYLKTETITIRVNLWPIIRTMLKCYKKSQTNLGLKRLLVYFVREISKQPLTFCRQKYNTIAMIDKQGNNENYIIAMMYWYFFFFFSTRTDNIPFTNHESSSMHRLYVPCAMSQLLCYYTFSIFFFLSPPQTCAAQCAKRGARGNASKKVNRIHTTTLHWGVNKHNVRNNNVIILLLWVWSACCKSKKHTNTHTHKEIVDKPLKLMRCTRSSDGVPLKWRFV